MSQNQPKIVVLGGGVTGLTAAWQLAKKFPGRVILIEKSAEAGGLAATYRRGIWSFDAGSHRIHSGYDPQVFKIIEEILGEDLLKRDRKGLLYLGGRFLNYPPSALDIMAGFGRREFILFFFSLLHAKVKKIFRANTSSTFEGYAKAEVGCKLYERFYEPYASKLYGTSPKKISREPAISRVRRFDLGAFIRVLRQLAGKPLKHFYFYPRRGTGALPEKIKELFLQEGGTLICSAEVESVSVKENKIQELRVKKDSGESLVIKTETVISTIPFDSLDKLVYPGVSQAPFELKWRGLRLIHLMTYGKIASPHETFYFPEPHIFFGRVSELSKYSPELNVDHGMSALTIEIPCSPGDEIWNMPDSEAADRCVHELKKIGLLDPAETRPPEFFSSKINHVYPLYSVGWRERFDKIYSRLNDVSNLYMIGRTALFLHCNMDHCMAMALRLSRFLSSGSASKEDWKKLEREFMDYTVRE